MNIPSSDYIEQLPSDDSPITRDELDIIETVFKKDTQPVSKILLELKDSLIVSVLVLLILMLNIDEYIGRIYPPLGSSKLFLSMVKAIFAGIIFYFIKNINTLKKK